MNDLVEELKIFMADNDFTIENIAKKINRTPRTVWRFLHKEVKPQSRTEYRIRRLIENNERQSPNMP